jgi:hypothetical protein
MNLSKPTMHGKMLQVLHHLLWKDKHLRFGTGELRTSNPTRSRKGDSGNPMWKKNKKDNTSKKRKEKPEAIKDICA